MGDGRATIFLFDIDGTLVTTPGVGRRALARALAARFGDDRDVLATVHFGGMTDRAIVRAALAELGVPSVGVGAESTIDGVLADYLVDLADELTQADGLRVHAGVPETLATLSALTGVEVGLGTGNVRPGAELKLGHVGLGRRFLFGGFGCDHEERAEILRVGAARGAARLGRTVAGCRIVVVGDTPRDVAAARAIGALSIGVATCGFTVAELLGAGATWAVEDLAAGGVLSILRAAAG